jgi:hypothetical protein
MNWNWRGAPFPVAPVLIGAVITPNCPVFEILLTGSPYCARLNTLNSSARKSTEKRSLSGVRLVSAGSICHNEGPRAVFLPRFPQVPFASTARQLD